MLLPILITLVSVLLLVQWYALIRLRRIRRNGKTRQIVPHRTLSIVDFIRIVLNFPHEPVNIHNLFPDAEIVAVSAFFKPCIIVFDPVLVRQVLARGRVFRRSADTFAKLDDELKEVLPIHGLVSSDVEESRRQRRLLNSGFEMRELDSMLHIFMRNVRNLLEGKWVPMAQEGRVIDVLPYCRLLTLDIIGRCAFGIDMHAVERGVCDIAQDIDRVMNSQSLILYFMIPGGMKLPLPQPRRFLASSRRLMDKMTEIITERREKTRERNTVSNDEQHDIMDIMLKEDTSTGNPLFNDRQIRDNALVCTCNSYYDDIDSFFMSKSFISLI